MQRVGSNGFCASSFFPLLLIVTALCWSICVPTRTGMTMLSMLQVRRDGSRLAASVSPNPKSQARLAQEKRGIPPARRQRAACPKRFPTLLQPSLFPSTWFINQRFAAAFPFATEQLHHTRQLWALQNRRTTGTRAITLDLPSRPRTEPISSNRPSTATELPTMKVTFKVCQAGLGRS